MRHSVSLGDTLSEEDILRVHSSVSGITRLHQLQRKTYARSMSVPAADPSRLTNIPTLEVFDEEDEVINYLGFSSRGGGGAGGRGVVNSAKKH